jgi:chromosome segregation ATPase
MMASSIKRYGVPEMRPVEFTTEQIIEAGQALRVAGRNITGFALRQKVGGGNPSRLKQVWDEHISSQAVTKAEPVAELPVEVAEEVAAVTKALTERLAMLAVELNDKAVKAAERRVAEVIRTAGEQREQAERELADAAQTVDDLEAKLDEVRGEAQGLTDRLADLQGAHQAQAVELAQLRERLAMIEQGATKASEDHAAELARVNAGAEAERGRLTQEADHMRAELAAARGEAAQAREACANLNGQLEATRAQQAELLRALEGRQPMVGGQSNAKGKRQG